MERLSPAMVYCVMRACDILQDELLGLANDPQEGCFADQIEPTVLLRQSEDRQVQTRFQLPDVSVQSIWPLFLHLLA